MTKKQSQFMKYKLINSGAQTESNKKEEKKSDSGRGFDRQKSAIRQDKPKTENNRNQDFRKNSRGSNKDRNNDRNSDRNNDRNNNRYSERSKNKNIDDSRDNRGPFRSQKDKNFKKRNKFEHKKSNEKIKINSPLSTMVQGEVQIKQKGFGFLLHKPEDIFISPEFAKQLVTGDKIKAWINPKTKDIIKIEILQRTLKQFIGTYDTSSGQRFVTLNEKGTNIEILIKERPVVEGLKDGDKVLVEVTKYEPKLEGKIHKTFGKKLAPKFDTYSVVLRAQWPNEFSEQALEEAKTLSHNIQKEEAEKNYKGRRDFREKPFVTIDGKDARDFDDAVLVEKTAAGYVLYVAIADVSEFVREGTRLNEEAFARSTSVYFPEWVVPMLPEALSNGACSLRPDEEKLTLTCEMHFDHEGKKRSTKIYESVIRSHRRCIYEEVQVEFESGNEFWKVPYELFKKIRIRRFKRGALDLDLPEAKVILDENDDTIDIKKFDRVDAHKVIEEFMIAANEAVTEVMERERWPFVYRVHESPKPDALEKFERFAAALGIQANIGEGNDPKLISKFITNIKDQPYAQTLNYLLLRAMKQARYEPINLYHFGLASRAYTHFTSPIRRYPDLMVHRILKRYVRHQAFSEKEEEEFVHYLVEACEHCSKQERKAEELDRKVTKIKKARFMEKKYGENFSARITNVSESSLFIELEDHFVDGVIPIEELGNDYFEYDERRMMLRGKRSGKKYKIGDLIKVSLLRVDVDQGLIDFTLISDSNR